MDENAARAAFQAALETYQPAFGTFFLARLLGLEISYPEDFCRVELEVKDFMYNPQGALHGGVIATILDISMGHLVNHSFGRPAVTLEIKSQFLRPVRVGRISCEGRFLKRGRRINTLEARMTNEQGKLAAAGTSTWQMVEP